MKRYEGLKREERVIHCPKCNEEIGFADLICPHCGADARVEKRMYRPGLSSQDIQPEPRERVGGPREPDESYFSSIESVGIVLTSCAVAFAILIGWFMGSENNSLLTGILSGVLAAAALIALARAVWVGLRNSAYTAMNTERTALGIEYQIEQLNEILTFCNKHTVFAKNHSAMLRTVVVRLNKFDTERRDTLFQLGRSASAVTKKYNLDPAHPSPADIKPVTPANSETVSVEDEPIFADDFAVKPETAEDKQPDEKVTEPEKLSEAETEAEEAEEAKEAKEAEESEEAEKPVEAAKEAAATEITKESEESTGIYAVECPKCGNTLNYTDEQLDNSETELICENCGTTILLEVQNEIENTGADDGFDESLLDEDDDLPVISDDAQREYERIFGENDMAGGTFKSRLEAFLFGDDEDEDEYDDEDDDDDEDEDEWS